MRRGVGRRCGWWGRGGRPVMTVEHWDKPEEGVSVGTSSFDMNLCSTVETDPGIKTLTHKTDQSLTFRSWWSAAGQPPPAASPKWSILPWRWRGGSTVRRRLSEGKTPFLQWAPSSSSQDPPDSQRSAVPQKGRTKPPVCLNFLLLLFFLTSTPWPYLLPLVSLCVFLRVSVFSWASPAVSPLPG